MADEELNTGPGEEKFPEAPAPRTGRCFHGKRSGLNNNSGGSSKKAANTIFPPKNNKARVVTIAPTGNRHLAQAEVKTDKRCSF